MAYSVIKVEGTISVKQVLDLFPPGNILFMQDYAVIPVAFNGADFLLCRRKDPEIKNFTCIKAVEIGTKMLCYDWQMHDKRNPSCKNKHR